MNRLLRTLLLLLAFCCAMRSWQYYAGVRLMIFDLLLVGFTGAYALRLLARRRLPVLPADLRGVVILRWLVFLLSVATWYQIDFLLEPAATKQFAKGVASLLLYAGGLSAILLYLWEEGTAVTRSVLCAYVLGAAASCVFSFFEIGFAYFGYDLAKVVFRAISVYPPDFDWSAPFYYEWDGFFRAKGFTGVNAQATYASSAAMVLLLASPFRRLTSWVLLAICLGGAAVTLSRNGFFTICITLGLYLALNPALALRVVRPLLFALLPLGIVAAVYSDSAFRLLATRTYHSVKDFGRGRWEIYGAAWETIVSRPLGHGVNQFSVTITKTKRIDIREIEAQYFNQTEEQLRAAYVNLHNNWINWLFEGGWPLLAAWILYYALILGVCRRSGTPAGMAGFALLSSLLVSGFFNMTLDLFSTELLFILLPVSAALGRRPAQPGPGATVPAARAHPVPC